MININGLDWKIVLDENGILPEERFGSTYYTTQTIIINKNICEEARHRTLIHELIHAYTYSIGYNEKETYNREELSEFISHNLSNITVLFEMAVKELEK